MNPQQPYGAMPPIDPNQPQQGYPPQQNFTQQGYPQQGGQPNFGPPQQNFNTPQGPAPMAQAPAGPMGMPPNPYGAPSPMGAPQNFAPPLPAGNYQQGAPMSAPMGTPPAPGAQNLYAPAQPMNQQSSTRGNEPVYLDFTADQDFLNSEIDFDPEADANAELGAILPSEFVFNTTDRGYVAHVSYKETDASKCWQKKQAPDGTWYTQTQVVLKLAGTDQGIPANLARSLQGRQITRVISTRVTQGGTTTLQGLLQAIGLGKQLASAPRTVIAQVQLLNAALTGQSKAACQVVVDWEWSDYEKEHINAMGQKVEAREHFRLRSWKNAGRFTDNSPNPDRAYRRQGEGMDRILRARAVTRLLPVNTNQVAANNVAAIPGFAPQQQQQQVPMQQYAPQQGFAPPQQQQFAPPQQMQQQPMQPTQQPMFDPNNQQYGGQAVQGTNGPVQQHMQAPVDMSAPPPPPPTTESGSAPARRGRGAGRS